MAYAGKPSMQYLIVILASLALRVACMSCELMLSGRLKMRRVH